MYSLNSYTFNTDHLLLFQTRHTHNDISWQSASCPFSVIDDIQPATKWIRQKPFSQQASGVKPVGSEL